MTLFITRLTKLSLGLLVGCALSTSTALAQNQRRICGTDLHTAELESQNPNLAEARAQLDAQIQRMLLQPSTTDRNSPATRIIPTVVHIVHQFGSENISKSEILATINQLNLDMVRRNSDTNTPRTLFQSVAGDLNLEFRLATLDPSGNPTDGITRVENHNTDSPATRDSVKYARVWPDNYFNLWIVKGINSNGAPGGGTILGYAQFPAAAANWNTWGVVMIAGEALSRASRTLTHEAGHCFNLYHTFQSGCTGGDQVSDTPPAAADTYGCATTQNTCSNDNPNQVDMIENYMSYDACQNMFTRGQRTRVNSSFTSLTFLQNLISASNLTTTGTDDATFANPAPTTPIAYFGSPLQSACTGTPVIIYDGSYNGTIDNTWEYIYTVPGTTQRIFRGFGNAAKNITVTFDTAGTFPIKLVVRNANGADSITRTIFTVRPGTARIVVPVGSSYREEFNANTLATNADPFMNFYTDGGWVVAPTTAPGATAGSKSVRVPNRGTGVVAGVPRYLYTPTVNVSAVTGIPKMYFYRALSPRTSTATADKLEVQISTDCGVTWTTRISRTMSTATNPLNTTTATYTSATTWVPAQADWKVDSLPLNVSAAQRQKIQVRFVMTPANSNPLYIDDVQFGNSFSRVTAIGDLSTVCRECVGLEIVPNPATASALLEITNGAKENTLTITDATGKLIATRILTTQGSKSYSLQEVAPGIRAGVYIVRLESAGKHVVRRMVVAE